MFPDVFRPLGDHTIRTATAGLLRYHRRNVLEPAGLGHLPLHVTEHGWPTGPNRTPDQQASAIRDVIEAVLEQKDELNIAAYELFSLRDADSSNPDMERQPSCGHRPVRRRIRNVSRRTHLDERAKDNATNS